MVFWTVEARVVVRFSEESTMFFSGSRESEGGAWAVDLALWDLCSVSGKAKMMKMSVAPP